MLIAGADAWVRDFACLLQKAGIPVVLVDTNFNKIAQARISGLDAICANILNEHVHDELPLAGIGQMMAMTANDEVNSLSIRECRSLFDRAHLYQLSFNSENQHFRRGMPAKLIGRALFTKGLNFSRIEEMHAAGARFKLTTLSDEFTFDDYVDRYRDGLTLMCVIKSDQSLAINAVDNPVIPAPGETIIALVSTPDAEPATTDDS